MNTSVKQPVTDNVTNERLELERVAKAKQAQEQVKQRDANILANYKALALATVSNKLNKSKATTGAVQSGIREHVHYELMTQDITRIQSYINYASKKLLKDADLIKPNSLKNAGILWAVNELNNYIQIKRDNNKLDIEHAINKANNNKQLELVKLLNIQSNKLKDTNYTDASIKHALYLITILNDFVNCNVNNVADVE